MRNEINDDGIVKSLFDEVRELSLEAIIEHYTGEALIPCGTDTLQLESKTCPFPNCGHRDCFKVKTTDDPDERTLAKCFSDGGWCNDGTGFLAKLKGIPPYQAAKQILVDSQEIDFSEPKAVAPKGKGKALDSASSVLSPQRHRAIFEEANAYYKHVLRCSLPAQEYQSKVRGHSLETLFKNSVGYSDGNLVPHLRQKGFTITEIVASGLGKEGRWDHFPRGSYIYAHMNNAGQTCHFTQKDPNKANKWKLANQHQLGKIDFYGEYTLPSLGSPKQIFLVEGENDLLSLREAGWAGAVLATSPHFE